MLTETLEEHLERHGYPLNVKSCPPPERTWVRPSAEGAAAESAQQAASLPREPTSQASPSSVAGTPSSSPQQVAPGEFSSATPGAPGSTSSICEGDRTDNHAGVCAHIGSASSVIAAVAGARAVATGFTATTAGKLDVGTGKPAKADVDDPHPGEVTQEVANIDEHAVVTF